VVCSCTVAQTDSVRSEARDLETPFAGATAILDRRPLNASSDPNRDAKLTVNGFAKSR